MGRLDLRYRCLALTLLAGSLYAQCCQNTVAVIASLSGNAQIVSSRSHQHNVAAALDWLAEGDTLELGARSQAVVILENGHRYQLEARAKITVTSGSTPKLTGFVRELLALPPIPRPASIAATSANTLGAVRIRGGGMSDLYPRAGWLAVPDKVILKYKSVPEATSYRLTLEDEAGKSVWGTTTETTTISIPSGTLKGGAHYSWRVRALRSGIEIGSGTEEFDTLRVEDSLSREEFAKAARAAAIRRRWGSLPMLICGWA